MRSELAPTRSELALLQWLGCVDDTASLPWEQGSRVRRGECVGVLEVGGSPPVRCTLAARA